MMETSMGKDSKIAWTHHTFNPWWGCTKVSEECRHCYAEGVAERFGTKWGPQALRRMFGDKHWSEPLKWDRAAATAGERHRVFCASMADVFEDRVDLRESRLRLWKLIEATPNLDWLLLTKQPQNIASMVPTEWLDSPQENVWLGTTVGCKRSTPRILDLVRVPAVVHFLSMEPLLEEIDLIDAIGKAGLAQLGIEYAGKVVGLGGAPAIDWVIIGGESGPKARPCDVEWIRSLVRQCREAGTACFIKQLGSHVIGGLYGDRSHFLDRAAADPSEWADDLRVRELPDIRR